MVGSSETYFRTGQYVFALGRNAIAPDKKKRWDAAKQQDAEALEATLIVASRTAFFGWTKA